MSPLSTKRMQKQSSLLSPGMAVLFAGIAGLTTSTQANEVWTWGSNQNGQLGNETYQNRPYGRQVTTLVGSTAIAAGSSHSLAVLSNGTVMAWGGNDWGQLGTGDRNDSFVPVAVADLTNVVAITAGHSNSFAIQSDGSVWGWGLNSGLIAGTSETLVLLPTKIMGLEGIVEFASGGGHSLALRSDGTVWSSGNNAYGQLGDGSFANRSTYNQIAGLTRVIAVACGPHHSFALRADGILFAWGRNDDGQLGDGTAIVRTRPKLVPGLNRSLAASGGFRHSLALAVDGTVWAWGYGGNGQLGNTYSSSLVPVQASPLESAIAIAAGGDHSLAIRRPFDSGIVMSWGRGAWGQLGNNQYEDRWRPISVIMGPSARSVSGGARHSIALSSSARIGGNITTPNLSTTNQHIVSIDVTADNTTAPLLRHRAGVGQSGGFGFDSPMTGHFNISFRSGNSLRTTLRGVAVTDLGNSSLEVVLTCGDINGDNTINAVDFLLLRASFGSDSTAANWNAFADLNLDGNVDISDFLTLRSNFGKSGDW